MLFQRFFFPILFFNFTLFYFTILCWFCHTSTWIHHGCTAKLLQSCPTLCDPIEGSPPGSIVPGILQARTLEWVAISFSSAWKWKVKVQLLSHVRLFATPWTSAHQAPRPMGFSRQEYWSGVPLPSPPQVYTCSQSWTPLPSPSPYHLSWSSQCTSPKHPVSCIKPRLAICFLYDIIHVSMPFSQIIPPSPSPTESKRWFYTSVYLLLSRMQGYKSTVALTLPVLFLCLLHSSFRRTSYPVRRQTYTEKAAARWLVSHKTSVLWQVEPSDETAAIGQQLDCKPLNSKSHSVLLMGISLVFSGLF